MKISLYFIKSGSLFVSSQHVITFKVKFLFSPHQKKEKNKRSAIHVYVQLMSNENRFLDWSPFKTLWKLFRIRVQLFYFHEHLSDLWIFFSFFLSFRLHLAQLAALYFCLPVSALGFECPFEHNFLLICVSISVQLSENLVDFSNLIQSKRHQNPQTTPRCDIFILNFFFVTHIPFVKVPSMSTVKHLRTFTLESKCVDRAQ